MKGRNYDPIDHKRFDINGTWMLENKSLILTNKELETLR